VTRNVRPNFEDVCSCERRKKINIHRLAKRQPSFIA
jgi:hypothetical protein